jgi:hypothetical protein
MIYPIKLNKLGIKSNSVSGNDKLKTRPKGNYFTLQIKGMNETG